MRERSIGNVTLKFADEDEKGEGLHGGDGRDFLFGGRGNDALWGGGGDDFLFGGGGDDYLAGGDGDDFLFGGSGSDVMLGGDGDDRIIAGGGDIAEGGDGADAFMLLMWHQDMVRIADFNADEGDRLMMYGAGDDWKVEQADTFALVSFAHGAQVAFYGIAAEDIAADPSLFGLTLPDDLLL